MKLKPRFRWSHVLLLFFLLLFSYTGSLKFSMAKEKQLAAFDTLAVTASIGSYLAISRKMSYLRVGQRANLPVVVFLHGSPGSRADFMYTLKDTLLHARVDMIAVDRPGFGATTKHGIAEASLEQQAAALRPLIKQLAPRKIILVGHSWGGPLIARMAMDYGEQIDGLIFIGASLSPALEPPSWYRPIMAFPLFRWAIPRTLVASNTELQYAVRELNEMLPLWNKIKTPYTIVQGLADSLVPAENAAFAKEKLIHAPLKKEWIIENMDHFVPSTYPQYIRQAIFTLLEESN